MDSDHSPKELQPISAAQLRALFELAHRLQELQAELEFVKLMMSMRLPRP
jgi:hypothetical protein